MKRAPIVVFGVTTAASVPLLGNLPRLLAESGWKVHIVCSGDANSDWTTQENLSFHEIKMNRDFSPIEDFAALARWLKLLAAVRPDIVSAGTPKAALLAMLAAKILRVPSRIYTLRGLRLETAIGTKRCFLLLAERITSLSATRIFSVSQSLTREYSRILARSASKIEVVGPGSSHGVDLERFRPRDRTEIRFEDPNLRTVAEGQRLVIGFVGRLTTDKGLDALIACREGLEAAGIIHRFLIVGPKERGSEILTRLETVNTPVTFTGQVEDTSLFYSLMDLLVLPTKREGFPNVVLEAGASGVAVVTTNATGSVDSVRHGLTGLMAEKNSVQSFVDLTIEAARDRALRQKLGAGAREWVAANFNQSEVVRLYAKRYMQELA